MIVVDLIKRFGQFFTDGAVTHGFHDSSMYRNGYNAIVCAIETRDPGLRFAHTTPTYARPGTFVPVVTRSACCCSAPMARSPHYRRCPTRSLAEGFRRAVLAFLAKERTIADALRAKNSQNIRSRSARPSPMQRPDAPDRADRRSGRGAAHPQASATLGRWAPEPAERDPSVHAPDWPRNAVIPFTYHPVPDIA